MGKVRSIILAICLTLIVVMATYRLFQVLSYILLYRALVFVSWVVTILFMLTISTCYYCRYFTAKWIDWHPLTCSVSEDSKAREGESFFHRYHRYFFWGAVGFAILQVFLSIPFGTFNFILRTLTIFSVSSLILTTFFALWVLSCHYFNYFLERIVQGLSTPSLTGKIGITAYQGFKKLNLYHGYIVWALIILLIIHFFLLFVPYFVKGVGEYKCCIVPACKMCAEGKWIFPGNSCRCRFELEQGNLENICPECRTGIALGKGILEGKRK